MNPLSAHSLASFSNVLWLSRPLARRQSFSMRLPVALKRLPGLLAMFAGIVLVAASAVEAQNPTVNRTVNPLPPIRPMPDGLPALALAKQPAVFSINLILQDGTGSINKGFFIDRGGLALCALPYLCMKSTLRFDSSDGAILAVPKVLAVFPERRLALVKFSHRPKAWLEIAGGRPPVGEWVALVSTLRDPAPPTGPILAYRLANSDEAPLKPGVEFSFATGRSPSLSRIFADGAPLINDTGQAVGVYSTEHPLPAQTLSFASPLDGLGEAITAALRKPLDLALPVPEKHHSYDPAWLDPALRLIGQAQMAGDFPLAMKRVRTLLEKYPDNRFLLITEAGLLTHFREDFPTDQFLELVRRTKPPEGADASARSSYLYRLGEAYSRTGDIAATMKANREAFELAPEISHSCGANLANSHLKRGELAEAERIYRKVVLIAPERIDYLEGLQRVLNEKGDWRQADELTPLIYQLEDLYRSH